MRHTILVIIGTIATATVYADENSVLRTEIKPLQFLTGWCWKGRFPDNKRTDTHCYESIYAGAHLRDRHAVTGGQQLYQGETIYSWNEETGEITYVYWNSYGGMSTGTATPHADYLAFPDESYVGPDGETVTISSVWKNITATGYDSLSIETHQNGETKEQRIHYKKRPFVSDPLDARYQLRKRNNYSDSVSPSRKSAP